MKDETFDELREAIARNRADIDALQAGAEAATARADSHDERVTQQEARINDLAARFDLDREVIAQLRAEGLLHEEHAAHLEHALRGSRKIGAAIGIVMATGELDEGEAFRFLSKVSMDTNRKLSVIATEVVDKRDASVLTTG